jgi:hypothetical protein
MTTFTLTDAYAVRRPMVGLPSGDELQHVGPEVRQLVERLSQAPLEGRSQILDCYLQALPDPNAVIMAMANVDPNGPPPVIAPPRKFATCADVLRLEAATPWVWEGWLPSAKIVGIAAGEGVGKTKLATDLARRVWHGLAWPDGQAMTLPPKSPTIWIAADGQQGELANALPLLSMPPESVVFPTAPDDPFGGTSLDDDETLQSLDEAIPIYKPAFVIIDSLTYATTFNIGEQRDIAKLKEPLVMLAQKHQLIVMLLLHVSKEGQALGRRVRGITRTLMHLEAPNSDRPERLRLWVEKSYAAKPPPLGVTIGPNGNTYDTSPPAKMESSKGGRPPEKLDKAIAFLEEKLVDGSACKAVDLISEWEGMGGNKTTLFNAKKKLETEGRLEADDSRKPQLWRLIQIGG